MSSRAGGGFGDTSSSARNEAEVTEEDENGDFITRECNFCPACKDIVIEDQDGLFCEGCNT